MARWKIHTPDGMQDILFKECYLKRDLEAKIRKLFRSYGYLEAETPSVEYYDVFAGDVDLVSQEAMFKFTDNAGRILVLRPDLTIPVARLAATRLMDSQLPMRFSYIGNVFSYNENGGGKQKEFTQAGVELLGAGSPEADAEVVALAIETIKVAGVTDFQIDIGQVEFFNGLMEEAGFAGEEAEQARMAIDRKDFISLEKILGRHDIDTGLKDIIMSLPHLFGSSELLKKLAKTTRNKRALNAVDDIGEVIGILDECGLGKYVSIDLGMVQSLDYYTGLIFKGFTRGVGFPILSGGRYDGVVGKFGRDCPAVGFSAGVNIILAALQYSRGDRAIPEFDAIVVYGKPELRRNALAVCSSLRKNGFTAEIDILDMDIAALIEYAIKKGIAAIVELVDEDSAGVLIVASGESKIVRLHELEAYLRKERGAL